MIMSDTMNEFRRLSGLDPMFEDRRLTEKKQIDVKGIVKKAEQTLGAAGPPIFGRDGFEMRLAVRGKPSPFTAVMDTSAQTGHELMWFEVVADAYDAVKGLLPAHTVKKERGGLLIVHPKESYSSKF
jgi:hypothetical protein